MLSLLGEIEGEGWVNQMFQGSIHQKEGRHVQVKEQLEQSIVFTTDFQLSMVLPSSLSW